MKSWKSYLAVTLLSLGIIHNSQAVKYSGLYTFGDSLSSDEGDWVSPGLVWPQYLADAMLQPGATYRNYAFGGARVEEVLDTVKGYLSTATKADATAI